MRLERVGRWIAWRIPRSLVYWCGIRLLAHGTTGEWSNTVVPQLTLSDALQRWRPPYPPRYRRDWADYATALLSWVFRRRVHVFPLRCAMHLAINVQTRRWGWVCFHPTVRVFGYRWRWYFYCSPDATPSSATYAVGPGLRD